jgi:hypothetical protein
MNYAMLSSVEIVFNPTEELCCVFELRRTIAKGSDALAILINYIRN